MSRIGKLPIEIKDGVNVVLEGSEIKVTGSKGELTHKIHPAVKVTIADGKIVVEAKPTEKDGGAFQGLTRTLIANMVKGVSEGFVKNLEFHGVGYRASMQGKDLVMSLGFSHPVNYTPREGIEIKVEKNVISVAGVDKQMVGQTAAEIRSLKKPEPYKGKGIRYQDEKIRRKAGKAASKG